MPTQKAEELGLPLADLAVLPSDGPESCPRNGPAGPPRSRLDSCLAGDLYRANIVVYFCKVSLAGRAPLDTMGLHEFACRHFDAGARPTESLAIITALAKLKPGLKPWRFDVGFARARFAVRQGARNVVRRRSRS